MSTRSLQPDHKKIIILLQVKKKRNIFEKCQNSPSIQKDTLKYVRNIIMIFFFNFIIEVYYFVMLEAKNKKFD